MNHIKALYFIIDITNPDSFEKIKNTIDICQKYYDENKNKWTKDDEKQPKSFRELPMLIIGNKIDLGSQRKIKNTELLNYVNTLQKDKNLVYINYHQVSVKDNKGIEALYQEILFFYYQQRINNKIINTPEDEQTSSINEDGEKKDIIKPKLNKNMLIFHQMLDKIKKPLISEINRLKEENKKDKKKKKKKIQDLMNKFNKEKNSLKDKNTNNYDSKKDDLNLKFKMKDSDIISIKAKKDSKLFEVLNMLCELCPGMENLKIKGLNIEGKDDITIDEMKTVSENKLEDNTILIINIE